MPTYNYECSACGHAFELFQSMTDKVKRKCPECGKQKLERLIGTGAGLIFKGSGFYETDYRSASYEAGRKQAESSTSADGKKADGRKADGDTASADKSGGKSADTPGTASASKPAKKAARKKAGGRD